MVTYLSLLLVATLLTAFAQDYPYDADAWGGDCKHGVWQSPVNLPACAKHVQVSTLSPQWGSAPVFMKMFQRSLQMEIKSEKSESPKLEISGPKGKRTFSLVNCHFHTEAEHLVGGIQNPMECHCVHKDDKDDDASLVVAFFVEPSSNEDFESTSIFTNMISTAQAQTHNATPANLSFAELSGALSFEKYWHYEGSLTVKPCTENVEWYVLAEPMKIKPNTLRTIIHWIGKPGNRRPTQPLNGRRISGCHSYVGRWQQPAEYTRHTEGEVELSTMQELSVSLFTGIACGTAGVFVLLAMQCSLADKKKPKL